jgi:hypothetical protein
MTDEKFVLLGDDLGHAYLVALEVGQIDTFMQATLGRSCQHCAMQVQMVPYDQMPGELVMSANFREAYFKDEADANRVLPHTKVRLTWQRLTNEVSGHTMCCAYAAPVRTWLVRREEWMK